MRYMTYKHLGGVYVYPIFSLDKEYRYCLGIISKDLLLTKTICVIMQNPSESNKYDDNADRTVKRLEKLVFEENNPLLKGVGKLLIVNLYPEVKKNGFEKGEDKNAENNYKCIRKCIGKADIILIGWGRTNWDNERAKTILKMIEEYPNKTVYKTDKHPSICASDKFLIKYDHRI